MGRYIDWEDVVDRYPEIETLGGADQVSSTYIVHAEGFVDAMLGSHFTPPFSSNNLTVKDLSIDCVYWRAGRLKLDDASTVREEFFETIKMLKDGTQQMVDASGNILSISKNSGVYSTTQSYHTSFGVDIPEYYQVSSDHMSDVEDSRL